MEENKKSSASRHLGQLGSYAIQTDQFDPTLLVAIPRSENREKFGITGTEFIGFDVWHCYEAGFLLDMGLPIAGTLKIIYSSNSESMVESKSFKLYLNSFDMYNIGTNNYDEAIERYCKIIKDHLSKLLNTFVEVDFFGSDFREVSKNKLSNNYIDLVKKVYEPNINKGLVLFDDYKGKRNHLEFLIRKDSQESRSYKYFANNLRSRCHITNQKDTGNALIHIITKPGFYLIESTLLQQIVSLREVDEFHENCAEKLYQDIMSTGKVEECSVILLYARRGSLDINPIRCSNNNLLPMDYLNVSYFSMKEQNQ